jgi:hypothetical protein
MNIPIRAAYSGRLHFSATTEVLQVGRLCIREQCFELCELYLGVPTGDSQSGLQRYAGNLFQDSNSGDLLTGTYQPTHVRESDTPLQLHVCRSKILFLQDTNEHRYLYLQGFITDGKIKKRWEFRGLLAETQELECCGN